MRFVVILAGGSGTRLWPLSRRGTPKQLLALFEGKSLLRFAYERAASVVDPSRILVCAGAPYLDIIAAQLPELPDENLLGEPVGRDSLAAVAWSMSEVARRDPAAVAAVLSADHVIEPAERFAQALQDAFAVAEADPTALVTFGVVPTSPHTGFGYLHRGAPLPGFPDVCAVAEFAEKPDRATAERYLASGDWWWNSGIFCWRAQTLLDQVRALVPELAAGLDAIQAAPGDIARLYPSLPKTSVDYAIMEPSSHGAGGLHVVAVALPITWHDVGNYAALARHLPQAGGNAAEGRVVILDAHDNILINRGSPGHLIAVAGLADTVVVVDGDVTLVCPAHATEAIKPLVELVRTQQGESYA